MGRAFEFRKARKFKRWGNMARVFTKLGKEITIAAKQGGPEPENNPRLRVLMQNAKKENMPKENVERAIKRAVSKDFTDYKEMNYEGYGPFGIAIFVETATDNTTRTVANVRSYFNKNGGSLGTSGSLEFLFDHKCVFHIPHETLSRQYAVNGDLLYEPFFLVPVSYRHRDFDKFFLYRRKICVKVQAFLCGAAFFIRCADFLFYVFGNLSDKFFIHTITSK